MPEVAEAGTWRVLTTSNAPGTVWSGWRTTFHEREIAKVAGSSSGTVQLTQTGSSANRTGWTRRSTRMSASPP
jgi:hypothetical protein